LISLVFLPVFFNYYTWPQYTSTAFWAAQAGLLLLIFSPPTQKTARALSGTLVFLSSLLRLNATLLTFLIFLPLWLYRYHQKPEALKSQLMGLFRIGLWILAAHLFDNLYYNLHPPWQVARQYDLNYSRLVEYKVPDYGKNLEVFRSFGWSPNDFCLFKSWMWLPPKFDGSTIQKLGQQACYDWSAKLKFWKEQSLNPDLLVFQLLISLFWFAAALRHRSAAGWIFLNTGVICSATIFLLLFLKLPPWVLYPQMFYWSLSNALLVALRQEWNPGLPRVKGSDPWGLTLLFALGLISLLWTADDFYGNRQRQEQERRFSWFLDRLPVQKNQLLVVWGSQLPIQDLSAFSDFHVFRKLDVAYLTWLQRSPITREKLDRFGIKDILKDSVDRKDIFIVLDPHLSYWQSYLQQTYGLSTDFHLVYPGLYQLVSKPVS
jgi:hypothetical protein